MKPSDRAKVAEYCDPDKTWVITNNVIHPYIPISVKIPPGQWRPESDSDQWKLLCTKLAELIDNNVIGLKKASDYSNNLRHYIAENDINALEALLLEVMG